MKKTYISPICEAEDLEVNDALLDLSFPKEQQKETDDNWSKEFNYKNFAEDDDNTFGF